MKPGILVVEILCLQMTDGFQNGGGHQMQILFQTAQHLQRVQQQGRGGADGVGGFSGDHTAIRQHHSAGRGTGGFRFQQGGGNSGENIRGHIGLLHDQFQLAHGFIAALALYLLHTGGIISAQDLHPGSLAANFIVGDAVAHHVYTHVRGGLIGGRAGDFLKDGIEYRENFHVAVIVYGSFTVGLQMEGVNHIDIVEICGGSFVCQIDRVLQRQIPDGEGLEFCITGGDTPLILVVKLRKAGGHFAAAGTGGGDHHQRMTGFNVVIVAQTFIADDVGNIVGIALDGIVPVAADTQRGQPL